CIPKKKPGASTLGHRTVSKNMPGRCCCACHSINQNRPSGKARFASQLKGPLFSLVSRLLIFLCPELDNSSCLFASSKLSPRIFKPVSFQLEASFTLSSFILSSFTLSSFTPSSFAFSSFRSAAAPASFSAGGRSFRDRALAKLIVFCLLVV